MIYRNKRDQESWLREKTLDSLKTNTYLKQGDIVQVASDNNFYEIVNETTDIALSNNLFAKIIPSEIIGNTTTADRIKVPVNINLSGDVSGTTSFDGSQDVNIAVTLNASDIAGIDASKVVSGVLDISRIPQGALERCIVVADDTARFNLTKEQVQVGDSVKVTNPDNLMYIVVDDTKLNQEAGYVAYSAAIKWDGIKDKPNKFPAEEHTHVKNEITDFPESLKNPSGLTISLNGTSQGTYDGSEVKNINITATDVGASKSDHNHDSTYLKLTGGTLTGNLTGSQSANISGFGKLYNAVWNDYAEFFERGEETEPGDIIALDTNSKEERYIKAVYPLSEDEKCCIVGVHSNSFAHLIGGENPPDEEDFYEYNIKKYIPVGLAGRVFVKIKGKIKKGDLISLSSIPGVGEKLNLFGFFIGVALEDKDTEDIGLVKMLIK